MAVCDEYTFVSSEVESLLQNVPLKKNIEIILNRVYSEKKFQQHLAKDSMGSPLGSLMPNVIMTELELMVVKDLFNKGYLKFYIQYMDDTLVLTKKSIVPIVLQALNGFHKNLSFTVDTFEAKKVLSLDLLIDINTTDIFYKDTHTGQYTNYNSFMPWKLKTSWVKSLYSRASKICSSKRLLKNQIELIEKFRLLNDFLKYVRKSLLKTCAKKPRNKKRTS